MENLKEKTAKGIAWGAINNGATQVLNLVFGIFLGRLLSTDDYGILALITIFTLLAGCIQAAGFSQALANLKPPTQRDYNAVAWFNIIAGFSLYIILFLCAPLIACFFDQPALTDVSRLAFLTIPISAIGIVPNAKLWIELRNREQAIASIAALLTSGICGVWLAWNGYGYWSLAWQQIVYITVMNIGRSFYTRWYPSLHIDFGPVRHMLPFSVKILVTNIINTISTNILTFIFGRLFPIKEVGNYTQAYNWDAKANSFISGTLMQIAQPVLASLNDERQREQRIFRKLMRFTAFLSFPVMLGFMLVAHEFILLTIGEQWTDSIPLLQVLCIGGAFVPFYALYQLCATWLQSTGRAGYATAASLLNKGVIYLAVLFVLEHFFGMYGIVFTAAVTDTLSLLAALILCRAASRRVCPAAV